MECLSPIRLFDVTSSGELEVATEAIQYLQTIVQPVGLVTVTGPPRSNKGFVASAVAKRLGVATQLPPGSPGAWLWPEVLPAKSIDEAGEHEFGVLVVETQEIAPEDGGAGQQILLITTLLSSYLVYVCPQSLNVAVDCLSLLTDLHVRVQILYLSCRKGQDSRQLLPLCLPALTFVVVDPVPKVTESAK